MKALILAGGGGTRLWPVSRKTQPKQIKPLLVSKTLLQLTYHRIRKGFKKKDIYIATGQQYKYLILKQLPQFPEENLFLEPVKKDTAAAIGLAATRFYKQNPHEYFVTINSDHYIKDVKSFIHYLKVIEKVIKQKPDYTVIMGINPTYPETGYGYIKMGRQVMQIGKDEIFEVEKFIEKPDLKTAKRFLKKWEYLWNPAYFAWRVDHLLKLFKRYLPSQYRIFQKILKKLGTSEEEKTIEKEFVKIKPISIDYGIMEKTKKMLVVPADFDWADVGHWRTIKDILSKDEKQNIVKGPHINLDTHGSLIYSLDGKLIATIGLKNMIVISTPDTLLICPKEKAQEVKKLVQKLEKKNLKKYL